MNLQEQYENIEKPENQNQEYDYIGLDKIHANETKLTDDYAGLGQRTLPEPPVYDRLQD